MTIYQCSYIFDELRKVPLQRLYLPQYMVYISDKVPMDTEKAPSKTNGETGS